MKSFVVFLCLCSISAVYCSSSNSSSDSNNTDSISGSSSSSSYTTPICQASNGFYCPPYSSCISRSLRCTGFYNAPLCEQRTYKHCDYSSSTGKFRVYKHSTPLGGISSRFNPFNCLGRELAHQFITYRGLMYEFGSYGSRVQDPLDPHYEYNTRRITKTVYVGLSSCTYNQVLRYINTWDNYDLCSHNCQDFAKGLGIYLTANCPAILSNNNFAIYIFDIAGTNCKTTLNVLTSTSESQSTATVHFFSFSTAVIVGMFTIVF